MDLHPIEIDVLLQRPIPVHIRHPESDVIGIAAGGSANTVILDRDPAESPVGRKIDIWFKGYEFTQTCTAYDASMLMATVDPPWSPVLDDGSFVAPVAGNTYVIEVVEIINLPRLGLDGLLPWLDEITAERQKNLRDSAKQVGIDKKDQLDVEFSIRNNAKAVVSDLNVPVQTPAGVRRILSLSLAKTGLPAAKQSEVLEYLMAAGYVAHNLARNLSTLYSTGERRPEPKAAQLEQAKKTFPGLKLGDAPNPTPGPEASQNLPGQDTNTTGSLSL